MAVTHTSRTGKTYYLHTGPKRGGGVQHFFSTNSAGSLAEQLPEGFEVYESVNGQVYLRRQQPKLIHNDELNCIARCIEKPRTGHRYKTEVRGNILTVYESSAGFGWLDPHLMPLSKREQEAIAEQFAHYQPVLRFILVDAQRRLFAPERFCFRGSVDDWISVGRAETIEKLASNYLKHLGRDSMYELF